MPSPFEKIAMPVVETRIPVRYAEVDRMRIAHHANYPVWFESGRTAFFQKLGLTYSEIEEGGVLLPLVEMQCRFLAPIRYEDNILVRTGLAEFTRVKIRFAYEIRLGLNSAATGWTTHAFTNHALKPLDLAKANPRLYQLLQKAAVLIE